MSMAFTLLLDSFYFFNISIFPYKLPVKHAILKLSFAKAGFLVLILGIAPGGIG